MLSDRWSPKSYALREFLARNQAPFRWLDVEKADRDPEPIAKQPTPQQQAMNNEKNARLAKMCDELARDERDEGHPAVVVHLAEARCLFQAESRPGEEHMLAQRAGRHGTVQLDQRRRI